jgi:hypothetical protein
MVNVTLSSILFIRVVFMSIISTHEFNQVILIQCPLRPRLRCEYHMVMISILQALHKWHIIFIKIQLNGLNASMHFH